MQSSADRSVQKVFVVINPKAGKEDQALEVRATLARHFTLRDWEIEIHETVEKEDIAAICRETCARGVSLVVAAGGDGTIIGVANGLVRSSVPLGILPLGTGNFLARALLVPLKLEDAADLLVGNHATTPVDALEVDGRHYFTNVSVGMSPQAVVETSSAAKKRLGRLAYVLAMIRQSAIFRLRRFKVELDGQSRWVRASEVLISNTTLLKRPPVVFGPPETLGDGQLEVYTVTARTPGDYLGLVWGLLFRPGQPAASLTHGTARRSVRVHSFRRPSLVQADGEVIGRTPVEILLVAKAIHVITPAKVRVPDQS